MNDTPQHDSDAKIGGVLETYLATIKGNIMSAQGCSHLPPCYQQGQFGIYPPSPYFAMYKAELGLRCAESYFTVLSCSLSMVASFAGLSQHNPSCSFYKDEANSMVIKGWNTDPIAHCVIGLDQNYYIMTMQIHCRDTGGECGKSHNLYDPVILEQFDQRLVAAFPAFLTHCSGIDKTLMTLIRAGMSQCVSASAWSKILFELHVHEHDLHELQYLHTVQKHMKQANNQDRSNCYLLFSEFDDKNGYGGFSPSRWYITNVYMDYMQHVHPILYQCMSALTGYVIKWDHSCKLPKYLMKLDGVATFSGLFTLVNKYEQIHYQAFVPTKSLSHFQVGLEAMVKSLKDHGHAQPVLGFTDNVASDIGTFLQCIPSLGENVKPVEPENEFLDLPRLSLPSDVSMVQCT